MLNERAFGRLISPEGVRREATREARRLLELADQREITVSEATVSVLDRGY